MNLVQPTPEMSVSIRAELREPESPEDIEKDIASIREWLSRQPHLPKDMGKSPFSLVKYPPNFKWSRKTHLKHNTCAKFPP